MLFERSYVTIENSPGVVILRKVVSLTDSWPGFVTLKQSQVTAQAYIQGVSGENKEVLSHFAHKDLTRQKCHMWCYTCFHYKGNFFFITQQVLMPYLLPDI